MKSYHRLYFLLALGLSISNYATASLLNTIIMYSTSERIYDDQLHSLFVDHFFNDEDTMPFSEIVSKIITVLEHKEKFLDGNEKRICIEVIKLFKKHQYDKSFQNWAKILTIDDLPKILPLKTQIFLDTIPLLTKIRTLKRKLG